MIFGILLNYLLKNKMVKELLRKCMKKGFLLDREMLEMFNSLDKKRAYEIIDVLGGMQLKERVVTKKVFNDNIERMRGSLFSSFREGDVLDIFSDLSGEKTNSMKNRTIEKVLKENKYNVKLITTSDFEQKKITVNDFIKHFRNRYDFLKGVLEDKDFDDLTSIRKLGKVKGNFTIIAAVISKRITKNKNLILKVEDMTGTVNIIVNENKKMLFEKANELLLDDIVAFGVNGSEEVLFCNDIYFPEAFLSEKRRHNDDVWVAFIGDMHCGSKFFLEKNFLRFIKWLNGKEGDDRYRAIAKKIRYLFVVGDMIDGVGHYPGQEKNLNIFSSVGQYSKVEEIIKLVRRDVQIIMSPGNHDSVWVGEPQAVVDKRLASGLYDIENLYMVPNPAMVEIEGGFKVLMYHGASINAFIDELSEIRIKYGHNSPTSVVKEMVKRRHLAPTHGAVDYVPKDVDSLVINPVPDIILTGDQHRCEVSIKNNIFLVSASCWQSSNSFMEKRGINSDPCKVPLFNLKTREVKILDFSDDGCGIEWESGEDLVCKLNEEKC